MKKIIRFSMLLLCILLLPVNAAAHSGRTDANGGHHDYKNKSGLGSYHYHCGGNPPHLHPDGICPYGNNTEASQPVYTPPSPSVKITDYPKELNVGETKGIEYTIENASSSQTSVVSSDENVVRVNEDRTLTAVGEGTAVITISGSGAPETFKVTVKSVPVQSVSIHNLPERLQLDTTAAAAAVISPDNATDKSIGWSSSDENIAEVDQAGKVTAKRTGTATITCRTQNGIEAQVPLEIFESRQYSRAGKAVYHRRIILPIWQKYKLHIIKDNIKIHRYFILFFLSNIVSHIILLKSMLFLIVSYRFHF